jgi:hypothetical protein
MFDVKSAMAFDGFFLSVNKITVHFCVANYMCRRIQDVTKKLYALLVYEEVVLSGNIESLFDVGINLLHPPCCSGNFSVTCVMHIV